MQWTFKSVRGTTLGLCICIAQPYCGLVFSHTAVSVSAAALACLQVLHHAQVLTAPSIKCFDWTATSDMQCKTLELVALGSIWFPACICNVWFAVVYYYDYCIRDKLQLIYECEHLVCVAAMQALELLLSCSRPYASHAMRNAQLNESTWKSAIQQLKNCLWVFLLLVVYSTLVLPILYAIQ